MNRYDIISLLALFVIVIALPIYTLAEPERLQNAQVEQQEQTLEKASTLYVAACATCHGASGEGIGMVPPLNHPALADAHPEALFKTIARAAHGSTMAAWHIDEGGILSDYQINELVSLIRYADWGQVSELAHEMDFERPAPTEEIGLAYLESELAEDPHRCVACHEDPQVHYGRFGLNCARCHSTVAWAPALLTKHIFAVDHGGEGQVECQICHVENYYEHSCYECHDDHQPDEMQTAHREIEEYTAEILCITCHPTGQAGEAERLMQQGQPIQANSGLQIDLAQASVK